MFKNLIRVCSFHKKAFSGVIAKTSYVFLEKVLEVVGLSIKTWKAGYIKYINSERQRVNIEY